jgi:hypothetical protein
MTAVLELLQITRELVVVVHHQLEAWLQALAVLVVHQQIIQLLDHQLLMLAAVVVAVTAAHQVQQAVALAQVMVLMALAVMVVLLRQRT